LVEVWVLFEHLYRPLFIICVSESLTKLWISEVVITQFAYEAVNHRVCLTTSTVSGCAIYFPSKSHADDIHESLFV